MNSVTDRMQLLIKIVLIVAVLANATAGGFAAPQLKLTSVPNFRDCGMVAGVATGIDPTQYFVAIVINVPGLGWYSKPYCDAIPPYARYTTLAADGSFSAPLCTGGIDNMATVVEAYLFPIASYPACYPSCITGARGVPASLVSAAVASDRMLRPAMPVIRWSGRNWLVKDSSWAYVSPGPNVFSSNSAWVDAAGALHLRISPHPPSSYWDCAEIWSQERLGYGTYRFYLDSPVDSLDPNAILGFFTYTDFNRDSDKREIDIEFAKWSVPTDPNAQSVVQPWNVAGNRYRFNMTSAATSTHSFTWQPNSIIFTSVEGHCPPGQCAPVNSWSFTRTADIPPSLDERAHINFYLNNGLAPTNGQPAEVVISRFEFEPWKDPVHRVLGTNSRVIYDPVTGGVASKYHFRLWGQVTTKDTGGFLLSDGGPSVVRALDPGHTFGIGDSVAADGILGDTSPKWLDTATERITLIERYMTAAQNHFSA